MNRGEHNRAAVRAFFAVAEDGNLDALDAIVSPDYVLHDPSSPEEIRGVEGARDLVTMYRNAMGGRRVTIDHQFSDGDYVATRFTARGTHDGEFMGATDRQERDGRLHHDHPLPLREGRRGMGALRHARRAAADRGAPRDGPKLRSPP